MLFFPPCKINIGLRILRRRQDGYHDLELSFFAVPQACDILEIVAAPADEFLATGIAVDIRAEDNLVVRARDLLRRICGNALPPCRIHLHKNLPSGAGLGGGSSDAASTLTGLNRVFSLGFSTAELETAAAELGSDCAFFVRNRTACIGTGRGERLQNLETDSMRQLRVWILVPSFSISTAEAYRNCLPQTGDPALESLLPLEPARWKENIENDFEKTLFPKYPRLKELKDFLYANAAVYASLSGSGSAVYGLFYPEKEPRLTPPGDCLILKGSIPIP